MRITDHINQIPDPSTRKALQAIWDQLKSDLDTNKAAFEGHYHGGNAVMDTPLDAGDEGEDIGFEQNLE